MLGRSVDTVWPEGMPAMDSFVLICGDSVLILECSDPPCTTGSTPADGLWTTASRVLIRGGSDSSRGADGVSLWIFRTVGSRILILCCSDPAAEAGSVLPPPDGVVLPSLAVTASLVLILGWSAGLGAELPPAGDRGGSVSGPDSGAGGSWDGAWPLGLSLLSAFFFFRRFSIPRSARRAAPTAVSSIRSPP